MKNALKRLLCFSYLFSDVHEQFREFSVIKILQVLWECTTAKSTVQITYKAIYFVGDFCHSTLFLFVMKKKQGNALKREGITSSKKSKPNWNPGYYGKDVALIIDLRVFSSLYKWSRTIIFIFLV